MPRLTVSVITRNSEPRLGRLLADVSAIADEIVVGVDSASTDRTLEVAAANADVVYRFAHSDHLAPARMLALDHASGDWILSLDDDESLEDGFDAILPELLSDTRITHYWFPRKCVVNLDPSEYLYAPPLFPDWQKRLFRNDPRLVWKPSFPHSGYRVQGPGSFDSRACILHFEALWCSDQARREKLLRYRRAGGDPKFDPMFSLLSDPRRRPVKLRTPAPLPPKKRAGIVHPAVHPTVLVKHPPWQSIIVCIDMPSLVSPGEAIIAEVIARNTGVLAWTPYAGDWPTLKLGYHLSECNGQLISWDGPRFSLPRFTPPGGEVTFVCTFEAPKTIGSYVLEWDLVSELECWFAECGGTVLSTPLDVR